MAMLDPIGSCNDAGVGRLILEREHELAELAAAAQEGRARWCSSPGRPGSASRAWSRRPQRPTELANRTGTSPRYVEEWLRGQAAGGYVEYSPGGRHLFAHRGTNALSQDGGYALGAQAGPGPIRRLATDAGFSRFRRVADTPFNIVYEARP
jgi:hypothetical protein